MFNVVTWNKTNKIIRLFDYQLTVNQYIYLDKLCKVEREVTIGGKSHTINHKQWKTILFIG